MDKYGYMIFVQDETTDVRAMAELFNRLGSKGYVLISSVAFNGKVQHTFIVELD